MRDRHSTAQFTKTYTHETLKNVVDKYRVQKEHRIVRTGMEYTTNEYTQRRKKTRKTNRTKKSSGYLV